MFILVAGGGKVASNLARALRRMSHEVTIVEQRRERFPQLEDEFEHAAILGDATEIFVLERAGIARPPDLVVAVTGDDEDNMVICQMARERYGAEKVIARVNDPRNEPHFDLLGISPTVSATQTIMALIEHEVPEHELALGRQAHLRPRPAHGVAPDLGDAGRPRRDPGLGDRASRGRSSAGHSRAGEGRRAPPSFAKEVRMRRIALAAIPLAALAAIVALRADGEPERAQLSIVRVASGLTEPVAITAPKNEPNNVYVAEKVGRVRVIVRGRLRARPFLDIRSLVLDKGEQG